MPSSLNGQAALIARKKKSISSKVRVKSCEFNLTGLFPVFASLAPTYSRRFSFNINKLCVKTA